MIPALQAALEAHVRAGAFPAGQLCVIERDVVRHHHAVGAGVTAETLFDVASVTKAVATTAIALVFTGRGALSLDRPVVEHLPALRGGGREAILVRHLLDHTTGLPAWRPLFADPSPALRAIFPGPNPQGFPAARAHLDALLQAQPLERPPGVRRLYSDLGFLLLGLVLEQVGGDRLDRLFARHVATPLGLTASRFFDLEQGVPAGRSIAPTGTTRPREPAPGQEGLFVVEPQPVREAPGEVDDDHAWARGGIAGHAGLFSTAGEIARFGAALLRELDGAGGLAPVEIVRMFVTPTTVAEGPTRALGFDVPAPAGSSAGSSLGRGPQGAFGHLGFTGCSLWVDRDRRLSVALLTNRVRPGRHNVAGIQAARPALHDLVCAALSSERTHQ